MAQTIPSLKSSEHDCATRPFFHKEPTPNLGVEAFNPIKKRHNKMEAVFEAASQLFEKYFISQEAKHFHGKQKHLTVVYEPSMPRTNNKEISLPESRGIT